MELLSDITEKLLCQEIKIMYTDVSTVNYYTVTEPLNIKS